MSKVIRISLAAALFSLTTACSTVQSAGAGLRASASLDAEAARSWSRPTEVGYDFTGQEIEGSASATSILFGLINFGSGDTSLLSGILGTIRGNEVDSPIARAAAYDAMTKVQDVDGIYVTRQTGNVFDFLGIYKKQDMTVRGKALRLRVLGEVSQERADRERYLHALPEGSTAGSALGGPIGGIVQELLK